MSKGQYYKDNLHHVNRCVVNKYVRTDWLYKNVARSREATDAMKRNDLVVKRPCFGESLVSLQKSVVSVATHRVARSYLCIIMLPL